MQCILTVILRAISLVGIHDRTGKYHSSTAQHSTSKPQYKQTTVKDITHMIITYRIWKMFFFSQYRQANVYNMVTNYIFLYII